MAIKKNHEKIGYNVHFQKEKGETGMNQAYSVKPFKTFRVNPELVTYVEAILKRRNILYQFNDDKTEISLHVPGSYFHKVVLRARCEELDNRKPTGIRRVHKDELEDSEVMKEIGDETFSIIGCD